MINEYYYYINREYYVIKMLSILYGVEENYKCQLNKQFEKIADLGNDGDIVIYN